MEEDDLIEAYLNHKLPDDALRSFEERLKIDAPFFDKVQLEKQLFESLNDNDWNFVSTSDIEDAQAYKTLFESEDVQQLKASISQAGSEYKKERRTSRRNWVLYSSAAIIAILFTAFSLWNTGSSETELYATYLNLSELPSFASRGDDDDSKTLIKAQRLFEKGVYEETIPILKNTSENITDFKATQYKYLGIAQMELNQFDEAEQTFTKLIASTDLVDANHGYWFKALLYLKKGEKDKASTVLEKIIKEQLFNHQKAAELLSEL